MGTIPHPLQLETANDRLIFLLISKTIGSDKEIEGSYDQIGQEHIVDNFSFSSFFILVESLILD